MAFYNDTNDMSSLLGAESSSTKKLWVFGYGSLLWNPGFEFVDTVVGYVKGYSRKFWQGNTVQRGTPRNPGRVATLVKDPEEVTWGRAYEPSDSGLTTSFSYLDRRECQLGGYQTTIVQFYPKDPKRKPFPVLLYIAKDGVSNSYLGPASMGELAGQIVSASGNCGSNVEYVVRLADFMREWLPEVVDEHLYTLEDHVKAEIMRKKLDLNLLMGSDSLKPTSRYGMADEDNLNNNLNNNNNNRATQRFSFTEKVSPNSLRCVKM